MLLSSWLFSLILLLFLSIVEAFAKYRYVCSHLVLGNFVYCQQCSSSSNITTKSVKTFTDDFTEFDCLHGRCLFIVGRQSFSRPRSLSWGTTGNSLLRRVIIRHRHRHRANRCRYWWLDRSFIVHLYISCVITLSVVAVYLKCCIK